MSLPLLHSPADILSRVMIGLGLGTDPVTDQGGDWPIYVASEPSEPDNCITIYDTTPILEGRSMVDGEQLRHLGFMVRIRAIDHPSGYAKTDSIRTTLNEQVWNAHVTIDTSTYVLAAVSRQNLGVTGQNVPNTKRRLFTINGTLAITRLS